MRGGVKESREKVSPNTSSNGVIGDTFRNEEIQGNARETETPNTTDSHSPWTSFLEVATACGIYSGSVSSWHATSPF